MIIVAVLIAGGLGAVLRFLVTRSVRTPWGVLVVNAVGSALAGALLGAADAASLGHDVTRVLLGGFAGGLTTFSTFTVETVERLRDGRGRTALVSIAANLALGCGLAVAAFAITATLAG